MDDLKRKIRDYWNAEVCGTRYGISGRSRREYLDSILFERSSRENFIQEFAEFSRYKEKRVLEIGVGAGHDFVEWIRAGSEAYGIDISEKSIELARENIKEHGLENNHFHLRVGDAEALPYSNNYFDLVYSYGVLHHTPDTVKALQEITRVLKQGGVLKAMVYHTPSWTSILLWLFYQACRGKPFVGLREVVSKHLESPATKAFSLKEIEKILQALGFEEIRLSLQLSTSDLLTLRLRTIYNTAAFRFFAKIYPRWLIKRIGRRFSLFLLIEAKKAI